MFNHIILIILSIFIGILCFTEFSYSLDFFNLNKTKYEIDEVDIGRMIGCKPGYMTTIVIRNSSSQKIVWSEMTVEKAKEGWIQKGKCWPSLSSSDFKHLWNRGKFVDFVVVGQDCGASCSQPVLMIYRFDGKKVTDVMHISEYGLKIDVDGDQMIAVYQIYEGQGLCRACPHRWTRVTYKWDGSTYRKIKSEETEEESNTSPW